MKTAQSSTKNKRSSKKTPPIYPIYLHDGIARRLVEKHAYEEFNNAPHYAGSYAEYSFTAQVQESGDVELCVTFRSDDGYVSRSGCCFRKTIQPYDAKQLAKFKKDRMFEIAEQEYFRRKREQELREIAIVQKELFGK